jgi:hypothetical protein
MTLNQQKLAHTTFEELKELAPTVTWHTSYNYYTKLPQFSAMKDGGIQFSMYKREWKGKGAELEACINHHAKDEGPVTVWPGLPKPTVREEIPRVDFKKYIQFVKDNLSLIEEIGG